MMEQPIEKSLDRRIDQRQERDDRYSDCRWAPTVHATEAHARKHTLLLRLKDVMIDAYGGLLMIIRAAGIRKGSGSGSSGTMQSRGRCTESLPVVAAKRTGET